MPTTMDEPSTNGHFGGAIPFKVQFKFDIPLFKGHIDISTFEKWLNMLEGYFIVSDFSNSENITLELLKDLPHVIDWWEKYYEKHVMDESIHCFVGPTWEDFVDSLKEQYYPIGSYDDQCTIWMALRQERGQTMLEFTNTFHTFPTKIGIKYSEKNMVLKYCGVLHRYIQTEIDFLETS
jgi:hypothetical protein